VQRLAMALPMTVTMLCFGSATYAQVVYPAEIVVCQPFPPDYPRGWELMVRYPCYTYATVRPSYYQSGYYSYPPAYSYRRSVVYRAHRRPYLRPGWWW
jgi:hypothetical protein